MKQFVLKKTRSIGHVTYPIGDAEDLIKDLKEISKLPLKATRDLIKRDKGSYTVKYRDSLKYGDNSYLNTATPPVLLDIVKFCKGKVDGPEKVNYLVTLTASGPKANLTFDKPGASVIDRFIFNFCYNEIYELRRNSLTSDAASVFVGHIGDDPLAETCIYIPANHYAIFTSGVFSDHVISVEAEHRKTYNNPSNPFSDLNFKRFPGYKYCVVVDILDSTNETETKSRAMLREIGAMTKEDIKDMGREYVDEKKAPPTTKSEEKKKERDITDLMNQ